ncbi:MAG TPA: glucose-6-phosphate dehydrogenase, partial [Polyangiaceae bacterium]|nr:glucose-6-phosphate dehydrogenase [Polyangiaceae bacterium]
HGAPPCTMVIFGATGDLTKRKLVPSLMNLAKDGLLDAQFAVIGVAIEKMDDDSFRKKVESDIAELDPEVLKFDNWKWFSKRIYYVGGDFADPATYAALKAKMEEVDAKHQCKANALFYLATAPSFFGKVAKQLGDAGLVTENGRFRRVIIEKPFGHDLASARALNAELRKVLEESQIYRIDHYLGKETVQNIMVLRFANAMFEPIWNSNYVDHVQITVAETLGVEHRGGYYDHAGALRDMVPNHIMQLLSLTAMEPPISFHADQIRDEQVKVLRAIQPIPADQVQQLAVRGQYGAGGAGGQFLPDYRSEPQVAKDSRTETYVAMKLAVDNWRWAGVPFYIRTGKRLAKRRTEIAIQFRKPPFLLFRRTNIGELLPNQLVLDIQPNEGLSVRFGAKVPGTIMNIGTVRMSFEYEDYFQKQRSTGYERLMFDCMLGDATLFQRADMVEAGWSVIAPLLEAWPKSNRIPIYPAGSWGPAEATALMARDGREWNEIAEASRIKTIPPPPRD